MVKRGWETTLAENLTRVARPMGNKRNSSPFERLQHVAVRSVPGGGVMGRSRACLASGAPLPRIHPSVEPPKRTEGSPLPGPAGLL